MSLHQPTAYDKKNSLKKTLSRSMRHAALLCGLLTMFAAGSELAASQPSSLETLKIGTLETSHFDNGSCRFSAKDSMGVPSPNVIIETDFSIAWMNINGRNMGFEVEHKGDHVAVLRTTIGLLELVEVSGAPDSDGSIQALYRMNITVSENQQKIIVDLLAICN
jgi:hypothetical protein